MTTPKSGAKTTATNHETMSAMLTTAKSENVYSPAELGSEADRNEAGDRDQRAGEHGEGVGPERECRGLHLVVALREAIERRVRGGHRVVDEQARAR